MDAQKKKKNHAMMWPSQSSDFNLIENLLNELDKRMRVHNYSSSTDFFQKLLEEWNNFTLDDIKSFIESMPRRCATVIGAKDMSTKY